MKERLKKRILRKEWILQIFLKNYTDYGKYRETPKDGEMHFYFYPTGEVSLENIGFYSTDNMNNYVAMYKRDFTVPPEKLIEWIDIHKKTLLLLWHGKDVSWEEMELKCALVGK